MILLSWLTRKQFATKPQNCANVLLRGNGRGPPEMQSLQCGGGSFWASFSRGCGTSLALLQFGSDSIRTIFPILLYTSPRENHSLSSIAGGRVSCRRGASPNKISRRSSTRLPCPKRSRDKSEPLLFYLTNTTVVAPLRSRHLLHNSSRHQGRHRCPPSAARSITLPPLRATTRRAYHHGVHHCHHCLPPPPVHITGGRNVSQYSNKRRLP